VIYSTIRNSVINHCDIQYNQRQCDKSLIYITDRESGINHCDIQYRQRQCDKSLWYTVQSDCISQWFFTLSLTTLYIIVIYHTVSDCTVYHSDLSHCLWLYCISQWFITLSMTVLYIIVIYHTVSDCTVYHSDLSLRDSVINDYDIQCSQRQCEKSLWYTV
jgi:hypothetical protein